LSEAGTRGWAPVHVRVRLAKLGADVETREGADAGTDASTDAGADASADASTDAGADAGADASADAGADAWVAVAGGWSSPKVACFPEAALRADDDLRATASSCARGFAAVFFLAPDVEPRAIRDSIEESEYKPK
jgi:hypothetical protein